MKRNLALSFVLLIFSILILRWQGSALITPSSPRGIIDLELARTPERLQQLRLFWNQEQLATNIYLNFLFIIAYTWFLFTACKYIQAKTNWVKSANLFASLAVAAGLFDVFEHFLLLLILNGRFNPSLLEVVFYTAITKFAFAGAVVLFLLLAWPFTLRRKTA